MTDEQLQAACGEANAQGLRTLMHALGAEAMKAATLAGCTQIEHGNFATDDVLRLMADRGTYFDPAPITLEMFQRALKIPKLKIVYGTDAAAGTHGRNVEQTIVRVLDGGQKPMAAIVAMTSLSAKSLRMGDRIGTVARSRDTILGWTKSWHGRCQVKRAHRQIRSGCGGAPDCGGHRFSHRPR